MFTVKFVSIFRNESHCVYKSYSYTFGGFSPRGRPGWEMEVDQLIRNSLPTLKWSCQGSKGLQICSSIQTKVIRD